MNQKKQLVTSLRVDPDLWKEAKVYAVRHDLSLGEFIDLAIRDKIKESK